MNPNDAHRSSIGLVTARHIYTGKIVTLSVDQVRLPNGAVAELEFIRHPGAAAVVPLTDDGQVIMIRQYRYAAGGFLYEIPAGKLHSGEDPRLCAERELEEEIGYRASTMELLTSILTTPGFTNEVIHIFLGTNLSKGIQQLEHDEVLDVVTWPLETAIRRIQDGTIRDAKTIVGLQSVYIKRCLAASF
ncbi:MAG: NUDIX hydrolase [Nitrospirae bacterium]|nr:MAG: NUDIX hydrolase [Nitrospirota bacterium]